MPLLVSAGQNVNVYIHTSTVRKDFHDHASASLFFSTKIKKSLCSHMCKKEKLPHSYRQQREIFAIHSYITYHNQLFSLKNKSFSVFIVIASNDCLQMYTKTQSALEIITLTFEQYELQINFVILFKSYNLQNKNNRYRSDFFSPTSQEKIL